MIKKLFVLILLAFLAMPSFAANVTFKNSRPLGCYDAFTIHRVNGPVYVTNDRNNTYKDISGVDRAGGAVAALYESDEPMASKLKKQKLCEIYDYLPQF